jgi:hypothetical protein
MGQNEGGMLEDWNDGILEWRNIGMLNLTPLIHYSTIPVLQFGVLWLM